MLVEIDPLPRAQGRPPFDDRERERGRGQRRAYVGRHIVGPFRGMTKDGVAVRNEPAQEPLQIRLDLRVGVLLDQQRGGCVTHVQREQSFPDLTTADPRHDLVRDVVKTPALCAETEFPTVLADGTPPRYTRPINSARRKQLTV